MQGHVSAAPDFEGYVFCYFGSLHLAFEMSCDTEYLGKNSFWFFRKRGLRRFGLCLFFWRFLYNSLKNVGQCHQNELTFLLKWRWRRPKVFALSCASLVFLVVNEKAVVRISRLFFVNYYLFLFDCSVGFCLRYFSKAMFSTLAPYILRLRCLVISNTQKNSFWFFWKRGLRRFVLCANVLMVFVQTFRKILGNFT